MYEYIHTKMYRSPRIWWNIHASISVPKKYACVWIDVGLSKIKKKNQQQQLLILKLVFLFV